MKLSLYNYPSVPPVLIWHKLNCLSWQSLYCLCPHFSCPLLALFSDKSQTFLKKIGETRPFGLCDLKQNKNYLFLIWQSIQFFMTGRGPTPTPYLSCGASLQEVIQACQGIPPWDATTLRTWSPQSPQKRKKGDRKKEKYCCYS